MRLKNHSHTMHPTTCLAEHKGIKVGDDFPLELVLFLPVCEFFYEILWLILILISSSVILRGLGEV